MVRKVGQIIGRGPRIWLVRAKSDAMRLREDEGTIAVAAGVSVKVISEQLGHASISFTLERYSHVLPSIQDEAAARVEWILMG